MRSPPQPIASALGAYPIPRFPRVPVDTGYLWVVSDVQVEGENIGTRRASERGGESASAHNQVTDDKNNQCPLPGVNDVPDIPPTPPEPPDGTTKLQNEPPSAELEGEWKVPASCNAGPTAGETDVSGLPGGDEDPWNRPKGAQNTSECQRERSEHKEEETSPTGARAELGDLGSKAHAPGASGCIEDIGKWLRKLHKASKHVRECSQRKGQRDSPRRTPGKPDDPGSKTNIPGIAHSYQEGPMDVGNGSGGETSHLRHQFLRPFRPFQVGFFVELKWV